MTMTFLERARSGRTTTRQWRLGLAMAAIGTILAGGAALRAAAPVPLPAFDLLGLDGVRVASADALPDSGKWLILYVQPNCRPCDKLLRLIKPEEHPTLALRMVVIVGGSDQTVAEDLRGKTPNLVDARWFADDGRKAWTALRMTGVPMVFGVRNRTVEWSLSGMLPSDAKVTSMLTSWTAE